MKDLIYLASPYSSPTDGQLTPDERFRLAMDAVACLMRGGFSVWSTIVHCHPIANRYQLPIDAQYWKSHNEAFIARCTEVWVLCIPEWKLSKGIQMELEFAAQLGKPVKYILPAEFPHTDWTIALSSPADTSR